MRFVDDDDVVVAVQDRQIEQDGRFVRQLPVQEDRGVAPDRPFQVQRPAVDVDDLAGHGLGGQRCWVRPGQRRRREQRFATLSPSARTTTRVASTRRVVAAAATASYPAHARSTRAFRIGQQGGLDLIQAFRAKVFSKSRLCPGPGPRRRGGDSGTAARQLDRVGGDHRRVGVGFGDGVGGDGRSP